LSFTELYEDRSLPLVILPAYPQAMASERELLLPVRTRTSICPWELSCQVTAPYPALLPISFISEVYSPEENNRYFISE